MALEYLPDQEQLTETETVFVVHSPVPDWVKKDRIILPADQIDIALPIVDELNSLKGPDRARLKITEQCAVYDGLKELGVDFCYVCSRKRFLKDRKTLRMHKMFDTHYLKPKIPSTFRYFPRDIATKLPNGTILINKKFNFPHPFTPDYYGEGGRIFIIDNTSFSTSHNNVEKVVYPLDSGYLRDRGLIPIQLPPAIQQTTVLEQDSWYDEGINLVSHVDTCYAVIQDKNGQLHVITSNRFDQKLNTNDHTKFDYDEVKEHIFTTLENAGIDLHVVNNLEIPCSLNMFQAPNGKVLMTSGEKELQQIIENILGEENVITTSVPIKYIPSTRFGGIRCMIGEVPKELLKF
jgi:hypothetical protein